MSSPLTTSFLFACLAFGTPTLALAQAAGLRGAAQEPSLVARLPAPDATAAERVITIEAVAALRVVPTQLRLVFALSAPGGDTSAASAAARQLVAATRAKLPRLADGAPPVSDVDFIAAVPVYTWRVEEQAASKAVVEARSGARVQYNLHVEVPDEAAALTVIEAVAGPGVDLLAVDYWSDDLTRQQIAAEAKALAAAREKATRLLAVFPQAPVPVNVHAETHVLFPQQLYQRLPAAEDSAGNWYHGDNLPRVPASRPLHVYYRGLFGDLDAPERTMPGARHLEIVATVRLYYAAPERPVPAK